MHVKMYKRRIKLTIMHKTEILPLGYNFSYINCFIRCNNAKPQDLSDA